MSYAQMMKWNRKHPKGTHQPMIFDAPSFRGAKSIWSNEIECPKCGYKRPSVFFENGICDICNNDRQD